MRLAWSLSQHEEGRPCEDYRHSSLVQQSSIFGFRTVPRKGYPRPANEAVYTLRLKKPFIIFRQELIFIRN